MIIDLTESGVAQLSTDHSSISGVPKVITHCAPGLISTDFHSTNISGRASPKPDTAMVADNCRNYNYQRIVHTFHIGLQSRRQTTPASSECAQLWIPIPLLGQSKSLASFPVQAKLSRRMGPVPWPNAAKLRAWASIVWDENWMLNGYKTFIESLLNLENPACLQATLASGWPQKSSQTVPHCWLLHTSTRPSLSAVPPTSLSAPVTQTIVEH